MDIKSIVQVYHPSFPEPLLDRFIARTQSRILNETHTSVMPPRLFEVWEEMILALIEAWLNAEKTAKAIEEGEVSRVSEENRSVDFRKASDIGVPVAIQQQIMNGIVESHKRQFNAVRELP